LDWAVGFSLAAQSQEDDAPDFRILVLDLASYRFKAADSVRYFAQFSPRGPRTMPWIRLFRPLGDGQPEGGVVEDLDILPLALLADLHKHCLKFFTEVPATDRSSVLATVHRIWAASLSQPAEAGDHHALANLVGPLLLRTTSVGDARAQALHVLLKQVGLVPSTLITCGKCEKKIDRSADKCPQCETPHVRDVQPLLTDNKAWIDWNQEQEQTGNDSRSWKTLVQRILDQDKAPLRFLLVDDNAFQTGWAELVCMALGAQWVLDGPQHGQPQLGRTQEGQPQPGQPQAGQPQPGQPLLVGTRKLIGTENQEELPLEVYAVESADKWLDRISAFPKFAEGDGRLPSSETISAETIAQHPRPQISQAATVIQRFRFDCGLSTRDGEQPVPLVDILLLDLRLHQGKSLPAEAGYFQRLLQKAKEFCIDDPDQEVVISLPWPGFTRAELNLMADWVREALAGEPTARREDPRYHRALTLLPRLISLMDCSLPIVLFSSTGRREILEFLKPYGSIITAFEKPRLAAIPDPGVAGHTAGRFRDAIEAAFALVVARRLCGRLPKIGWSDISNGNAGHWTIELMLDEEGQLYDAKKRNNPDPDGLTLGGLLAVYPPGVEPEDIDRRLGCIPNPQQNGEYHEQIRAYKAYSKTNRAAIAEAILNLAKTHDLFVAAVSVTGKHSDLEHKNLDETDELHDERVADNMLRHLYRTLIESAIYCLARHHVPSTGAKVRFSVHASSRHLPLTDDGNRLKEIERSLLSRWGITPEYIGDNSQLWNAIELLNEWKPDCDADNAKLAQEALTACCADLIAWRDWEGMKRPEWSIRYVRFDSPRSFVEEIMSHYRDTTFDPPAEIIRAFPSNSYGKPAARYIRLMHFFADAILYRGRAADEYTDQLWNNGFRAQYGLRLATALKSHRLLQQGSFAEAFAEFAGLGSIPATGEELLEGIGGDLQAASMAVSGTEFLRFSRHLQEKRVSSSELGRLSGVVTGTAPGLLFIKDDAGRTFCARNRNCAEPISYFARGDRVTFVGLYDRFPGQFRPEDVRRER
jgi:hypothetical protein